MHPLTFAAIVFVVGLGTYAALIAAIKQYEKPKRQSLADIHDIHEGMPQIAPMPDTSTRYLDEIFGGYRTGAWPMVLELRKETPALPARERFTGPPTIEGTVIEAAKPRLAITATYGDYPTIQTLLEVGGR